MSMTTIFIPLFVYSLGMQRWHTMSEAILLVALFFVVERALIIAIVFPLSKLIESIGFRRSISLSVAFLILSTVSLILAEHNISWLWIATLAMGINIPLYWIARDSALSQDIAGSKMGTSMGYVVVLENIAGLMGPFVGGVTVLLFGYTSLFVAALIILGLSIVPLWWMPPHTHHNGVSLRGFGYFLRNGRYLHQIVANFGCALNDYGNGVIWPLILFVQGITHAKLGFVYSSAAIVTILVQYMSGKWFDRLRARRDYADEGVYGVATVGMAISWVLRIFVRGIAQIVSLDVGRQLFGTLYTNFYIDYLHLGGKRMGSIAFWVYMEVIYSAGTLFLFGVMAVGIYFNVWKELVLSTIALWSLGTIVMARESNLS